MSSRPLTEREKIAKSQRPQKGYVSADQPRLEDGSPDWSRVPGPLGPEPVAPPRRGNVSNRPDLALGNGKRIEQAIRMHLAGMTYKQIAEQLGYSSARTCHKSVWTYIDKYVPRSNVEQLREIERQRFDQLTAYLWSRVRADSPDSVVLPIIDRVLRISQARRQLLGLDLQPQIMLTTSGDGDAIDDAETIARRERWNALPVSRRQELYRELTGVIEGEAIEVKVESLTRPPRDAEGDREE